MRTNASHGTARPITVQNMNVLIGPTTLLSGVVRSTLSARPSNVLRRPTGITTVASARRTPVTMEFAHSRQLVPIAVAITPRATVPPLFAPKANVGQCRVEGCRFAAGSDDGYCKETHGCIESGCYKARLSFSLGPDGEEDMVRCPPHYREELTAAIAECQM